MTFIVRYHYWAGNMDKLYGHVIEGAVAGAGCAIAVPLADLAAKRIRARFEEPFALRLDPVGVPVGLATAGLWALSLAVFSRTMFAG